MQLLWAIEHGLNKKSKRMNTAIGLTGPQRLVLRIAGRFPGLSAGDLARIVQLHPSTLTGVLHRLVTRRLLRRERDPGDSRRIRLWPTARAARITRRSKGTVEEIVARALRMSDARDVLAARTVLAELAGTLNE